MTSARPTIELNADLEAAFAAWPTYAGKLCATHIGSVVEFHGHRGVLRAIRHTEDHPGVWVLIRCVDRQQHQFTLSADTVVSRVTSLHKRGTDA